ncbi:septal ring lytic transglycosylase RlpA family protein [Paucibacter sp. R3-3]|uniref:Endolytic peptidoglycan transglycosylase RlpA n=1 Tax=Roseateles agri TaxID=3098619 RepID=A0ABU5DRD7_9BURK|nr:septal ring lytic transglycosylase RlpA family protein [Paucibacter sp. R3-3]MDY0748880.1 septal ring lytic transglycosylase RlpA family protein [Paucibacter sp. R3-3]
MRERTSWGGALLALLLTLVLAGCASHRGVAERDGPEAVIPPDLQKVPDATPHVERIRAGGPNKPYDVDGQRYEPMTEDKPLVERGLASWYGKKFHGRPTSSGEVYNMYAMTAAHATMPIPSYARVRNPANGREVIVRINDRGPFHKGRIIDLSYTAALKLDVLRGVSPVEVERITYEDIRTGAWMRGRKSTDDPAPVYAAAEPVGAPQRETTADLRPAEDTSPAPVLPTVPATATAPPVPAPAVVPPAAAPGFWVQLGAFSKLDGAEAYREKLVRELDWLAPLLAIFKDRGLNRLQAGPYASRADAQAAADRVRHTMAQAAVVVERK